MRASALPPIVAAVVALAVSVARRLPPILLRSPVSLPSAETLSLYVAGGRFVAFVLIYGLLFGAAILAGRRGPDAPAASTALRTGAAAAVAFLSGSVAVVWYLGADRGPVLGAAFALGGAVGVGVQFAVVAYAGVALGGSGGGGSPDATA